MTYYITISSSCQHLRENFLNLLNFNFFKKNLLTNVANYVKIYAVVRHRFLCAVCHSFICDDNRQKETAHWLVSKALRDCLHSINSRFCMSYVSVDKKHYIILVLKNQVQNLKKCCVVNILGACFQINKKMRFKTI